VCPALPATLHELHVAIGTPVARVGAMTTTVHPPSSSRSTAGNVIAALASLFVAGLGQLLQGRVAWALVWFVAAVAAWVLSVVSFGLLGFVGGLVHIASCIHAALYRGA